ncbi:low specificity L-threonine aldolase [Micromonospora sp. NPDC049559]|uniref:threonine aldolase family protein n=1 Tax=Micromonospora sp. NPDC049559 TaxID=3155923 RepID=UPI00341E50A4
MNRTATPPQDVSRAFASDNNVGASAPVVDALAAAATGDAPSYGADHWTHGAKHRLSEIFERDVDIMLVSTGSAANALSLAAMTPPWGSVLCHRDSHINNDECGAPEFFTGGAKLVPLDGNNTKIDPEQLRRSARRKAGDVHSVQPAVLSITQATETGSVYSLEEIRRLTAIAREAGLRVHMDGARLANALVALDCSPAAATWKAGVDVLSLGASKNGTMTADVIVLFDSAFSTELAYRTKRAGQLAAKMRFQAAQIDAYLAEGLWLDNARHANMMAIRLRAGLEAVQSVDLLGTVEANILFCRLPQRVIQGLLAAGYTFYHDRWEPGVARFVTSFSTTAQDVDELLDTVRQLAERNSSYSSNRAERPTARHVRRSPSVGPSATGSSGVRPQPQVEEGASPSAQEPC